MTFTAKNIAATALIVLGSTLSASADVAPGTAAAIAEFNRSADSQDDVRLVRSGTGVSVSTRSGQNLEAYRIFNRNADSQDGIRGLNGATAYSGDVSRGAAIFADIAAASAEDE